MGYIVLVLFFIGRNILLQSFVLPLISYLLFFLQSLYYVLCRAKDQTPGTRAHQSLTPPVRELPLGNIRVLKDPKDLNPKLLLQRTAPASSLVRI